MEDFKAVNRLRGLVHLIGNFKMSDLDFNNLILPYGFTPLSMTQLLIGSKGFLRKTIIDVFRNSNIDIERKDTYYAYDNVITMLLRIMEAEEKYEFCAELVKFREDIKEHYIEGEERRTDLKEFLELIK